MPAPAAADSDIRPMDNKAVRSKRFIDWLYPQAKRDIPNTPVNDSFYAGLTHDPENGQHVYGYFIDGKPEGVIEVLTKYVKDTYFICWFFVNKKKHNLGIGQKLFNFVLDRFSGKSFVLTVRASNDRAIHIYKKYGFEIIETYENIIGGSKVKECAMRREPCLLESVGVYNMDDFFCGNR